MSQEKRVLDQRDGIVYRLVTEEDDEAVTELILSDFFPHMPMFVYPPAAVDAEMVRALGPLILSQRVSLLAEDAATGQLVGARINSVEQPDHKFELPPPPDEIPEHLVRFWQILAFDEVLESKVNFFEQFNVDKALNFRMLVVRQSYGRRGIGRRLNELSIELAKSMGFRLMTGSTESKFTQKLNESLGFQPVHSIAFKDYVDAETGDRPFVELDATVHKEAVMFAKLLD